MSDYFKTLIKQVKEKNPTQPEFIQAVTEVSEAILPYIEKEHPEWINLRLFERMVEPERVVIFRVTWTDDHNQVQINRGYRVQMNSAIGPYKGGLRFSPTVNLSILKFLAFEQVFKNSLTGIPLGGGKGGSDFDPKGKSDQEIMRFCQAFMSELYRHIGPETDVPAGDIGVGEREIGYLFGQYKKLRNEFTGVLTGKGFPWGGSHIRPEATGYGLLYFLDHMLQEHGHSIEGKTIAVSGAGNVAQFAALKAIEMGGKVVTLSNSGGTLYHKNGFSTEDILTVQQLQGANQRELKGAVKNAVFKKGSKPWEIACDIALPCATQNELDEQDARQLIKNKCIAVAEGANMPTTLSATKLLEKAGLLFAPGKAANAGGVAVSGLEMSQNRIGQQWPTDKVDQRLRTIMNHIHHTCVKYGTEEDGRINYVKGANIGGFIKVAKAMIAQGIV